MYLVRLEFEGKFYEFWEDRVCSFIFRGLGDV